MISSTDMMPTRRVLLMLSGKTRQIPINAASSDHATPALNLSSFFVIKLYLIYRNPTAVLVQRRQSDDILSQPAGNGQDEIPQTRYVVQARPDRLGQPENTARKRHRIGRYSHSGGLSLRHYEGEGVLGASANAGVHDRSRNFKSWQS